MIAKQQADKEMVKGRFLNKYVESQPWDGIQEIEDIEVKVVETQPSKPEIMYEIECPICLLCYTHENPPINLYCQEHPDHPFVLCKNEMLYYAMKAGSDKDIVMSCPICHNEIKFETKGKSIEQVMSIFQVNQQIVKMIEGDKKLRDYVEKELNDLNQFD